MASILAITSLGVNSYLGHDVEKKQIGKAIYEIRTAPMMYPIVDVYIENEKIERCFSKDKDLSLFREDMNNKDIEKYCRL